MIRAHALLRLYPPSWRERYQDEVEALLDQHTVTLATVLDLLWGALDARLDPAFTSERMFHPMSRLRTSAVMVFCAYAAFVLGFLAFQRLTDPRAPFDAAARAHPELGAALRVITLAPQAGLLAVVVGGVPIALDILWRAWRARDWRTLAFFATPPVLLVICAVYVYLAETVWLTFNRAGYVVGAPGDIVTLIIAFVLLFGSGLASTIVVSYAVARSQISLGALRFARWPALVATLAMVIEVGALLYWGAQSYNVARWLYDGSACGAGCPGLASANQISLTSLALVAIWMLAALGVAATNTARGFTTRGPDSGGIAPVTQAA